MASDDTALNLLGRSADWLKDADGVALGQYRRQVIDSLDWCWRHPEDEARLKSLEDAIIVLFQGIFFNQVYPPDAPFFVHRGPDDPKNFLPRAEYILADARALADTIITNKLGVGELHLDYVLTLIQRRLMKSPDDEEAVKVEEEARNWLFLRSPKFREMNLGDFSPDAKHRFLSLTPLRIARRIELMGDDLSGEVPMAERLRIIDRLADQGAERVSRYAPKSYGLSLLVLEFTGALEENVKARSEGRDSRSPMSARMAASGLVRCWRALRTDEGTPLAMRLRMANLIVTELARAIPRTEERVGRRIYVKLRAKTGDSPPIRHRALFEALPNDEERLQLVNFLYRAGERNPRHFVDRFSKYFELNQIEFVSKSAGFKLKPND